MCAFGFSHLLDVGHCEGAGDKARPAAAGGTFGVDEERLLSPCLITKGLPKTLHSRIKPERRTEGDLRARHCETMVGGDGCVFANRCTKYRETCYLVSD